MYFVEQKKNKLIFNILKIIDTKNVSKLYTPPSFTLKQLMFILNVINIKISKFHYIRNLSTLFKTLKIFIEI